MKLKDRVNFWIAQDDSDYASNCFGVEPQNDWYDVQYYPEQIEGIIIWNKGLLLVQQVYKGKHGIEMRGNVFDISRNGIKQRIEQINVMLKYYNMTIQEFLDDTEISTLDCFFDVVSLTSSDTLSPNAKLNRSQLYDIVEKYFNEHQDGYVNLNFEIEHNYKKLYFIELYKYDGGLHGDDFNFYFKTEDGKQASWYFSTIDTTTLNDIVQKMVGEVMCCASCFKEIPKNHFERRVFHDNEHCPKCGNDFMGGKWFSQPLPKDKIEKIRAVILE